jgi:HK97 family phage major capsid protein
MRNHTEIRSEHDRVRAALAAVYKDADRENREPTAREDERIAKLDRRASELESEYRRAREQELGARIDWDFDPRGRMDVGPTTKRSKLAIGPNETIADFMRGRGYDVDDEEENSFGLFLRDRLVGRPQAQMLEAEGDGSGGFFTVPTPTAINVLDRARNASRVIEAGAQTIVMDSATLSVPRLVTGVSPSWKVEAQPINEESMVFDSVILSAKTLPVITQISVELFEDALPSALSRIEEELALALAAELDRAVLFGSGVDPEPRGIANTPGIDTGSAPADWDDLVANVGTIRALNWNPTAAIWGSDTAATFAVLRSVPTGEYLVPPPYLGSVRRLESNVVENGSVVLGDFSQVMIGMRASVGVRLLTERYISNLCYGLVCYLRADVGLAHEEAFGFYGTT